MRRGDYAAAWAINDRVIRVRAGRPDDPSLPYHLRFVWDGRDFTGRDVLVRCYHGLGDTLQFARYLPALARVARSVTVEAQPELLPILRAMSGVDRFVPFRLAAPLPPAECDIEIMELAHALRLPPDAMPPPYLSAPAEHVAHARKRFGDRRIIGVCCRAGGWDSGRSISVAALQPGLAGCGASIVRLHRVAGIAGGWEPAWANPDDRLDDIAATAGLVGVADLVITVDTMIAHLAGAMGRRVWLLLKYDADWRWMDNRTDSPWYPTMRLYRQARPDDWGEPIAAVDCDLAALHPIGHPDGAARGERVSSTRR